jgi:CRISPR/Cas system-associated protein Cas7 (RAMP superfamily)
MRLPLIKHLVERFDEDYMEETIMVLEHLIEAPGIKDEELDVIGELISNIEGAKAVMQDMKSNKTELKTALNGFMKRVMGSIDK